MELISKSWKEENNTLTSEFKFNDFKEVSIFTMQLFNLYEELNHHPDTLLYGYKFIKITTTTHDAGNTLTNLDYELTRRIDALFDKFILN